MEQQRLTGGLGATDLKHFRRFRGLESGKNALRTEGWNSKGRGYVHANGRLQHWHSTGTGLRPQGLVEQQRLTGGLGESCRDGFEAF